MLDLILSYCVAVCSLWWLLVPIVVMGIFALIARITIGTY